MFKKLLLVFLSVNFILLSTFSPFVKVAQAQTWFRQDFFDWYTKVYDTNATPADEIYGERYTAAQVEWVIYGIWAFIINQFIDSDVVACIFGNWGDPISLGVCLATSFVNVLQDIYTTITSYNLNDPDSALALARYQKPLVSMVFEDRPLSGITYVKQRFNVVKEVQAQQGFGFGRLEFIQPLWRGARDVSFFILILATIIMAFMIMFRVKLSPQTVISVQSAIPRVVMAVILITFSYAIAGFMIDLVYVAIGLVAAMFTMAGGIFTDPPGPGSASGILYRMMTEGIPFIGLGAWGLMVIYMPIFFVAFSIAIVGTLGVMNLIPGLTFASMLPAFIITVLIGILLIFITIKILWMLIKTVVAIFLLVIAGPFYILGGALSPTLGFGAWIKSLASNLAVYPVVGAMFILSYVFLIWGAVATIANLPGVSVVVDLINNIFNFLGFDTALPGNAWQPPLTLNSPTGGNSIGVIFCFVSLSILFMIPKTADIIKGLISGRPYAYGTAIGEAFGPAAAGAAAGWGFASGGPSAWLQRNEAAIRAGTADPRILRRMQALERGVNVINRVTGWGGGRRS